MRKTKLIPFIVFLMASIFTLGFASKTNAAEKTYKIGTDLTFAPFEFQNSDGDYIGIDVDLLNQIAKDQNFKVDLRPLGFDSSIQGVQSDQLDGMIAGMSITDERKKTFDFSEPYFDSGIQMAVKNDNNNIKNYRDLKGKTVAAKIGTESATFLDKNKDKYGYEIKQYEAADAMYNALTNGNVEAIFDDYPVLGYAVTNGQSFKLVGDPEKGSSYGFAVKKGENKELLKKFNQGLKDLKKNGRYDKIVSEYISTGTSSAASSEMKKIKPKKDVYVVASDSAFAPFEYKDSDGEYKGIDVDLLKRIAELQGFNIEFKFIGFSSAMQALESGQADGMIAGMTITDERKANYDFSDPYFQSGIQLAVAKDNKDIKHYKDLKGKTVGAKVGTESADFLEAHKKEYGYTIKSFDAADQLYDALKVGSIDAMMDDYPVIGYAVKQGQELKTPIKREVGGEYGFAVKKGQNPELSAMFTEGLKELKQTGEYDKIIDRYIGSDSEKKQNTVDESTIVGLLKNNYKSLLDGLWKTIVLALVSFGLALVVGVIFGLFRVSPIRSLRTLAGIYIDIIRGIPMMVLAFFIFFGLPGITGIKIPDFAAGIITLTLNASAYIAEIVRGGINAVPVGQMEASRSLGLSYNRTMQKIILPQAVKIMIPSFINQFVISLKDTTIISAIGVVELLQTGKIIVARTTQSSYVYLIIAIMYLILITILTKLANRLDKKVK
ncbi:amino acid ABC transporter substrate-binding protein/permease [Enterococcus dongliensis]|uniref:Amino acid ABC transporter substrate-binding protein/permease n=1 Tax=Enterococcus dongliensis TaxID=2559925 RepID=A0AAP5KP21_9ENTE|nr:amino acid ABC transporter substrate-binding protein/permease [Enterococcus dongliensis]MDT2595831.1 amino acid ABC transporter substrate-binding protein/permease [Enterococcus dongliensis]MDT2602908.1 amino acid ABC transporter substrate-binding protein/permease [Enterococcus dongliensis]MDT2614012.1 amino acid ABC transporter substrate-binding protein/permease [Enterococcus dongliensis]MDT2633898.1 amino acid ABC transporter substrate-binding protein/permease [Enterococcus dongliensis]MDT